MHDCICGEIPGEFSERRRFTDLTARGFPLVGGRLEYIRGHSAVALVYQRRKHFINLFVWPEDAPESSTELVTRKGYALAHWVRGGLSYWAVSDAAPSEVQAFELAYVSEIDAGTKKEGSAK